MQLPTTRQIRVRRVLAVSAAALAVMVAPTACDYGAFGGSHSGDSFGGRPGHSGHSGATPTTSVVPVADTDSAAPTTTTDAAATTTTTTTGAPATGTTTAAPGTDTATAPADPTTAPPAAGGVDTVAAGGADGKNNGLQILGRDCSQSELPTHDGFQKSPACVTTQMGEVAAKDKLPSLLITDAPRVVGMNQAFTLKISTRNLVRDRFLGAKAGGYYLESSFLDDAGLQRGHFHTACRILPTTREAPDSSQDPQFFLATEDGGGGTTPDTVTIPVPAIGKPGVLQCTSWAGDGSHRTPMMTQANETPAIDSVRIFVTRRNQPVRFDGGAAGRDSRRTDVAQQQAGGQQADANPAVPAAPDAAAAPSEPVTESGAPANPDAAPVPGGDVTPPAAAAADAADDTAEATAAAEAEATADAEADAGN
jgi:hypothetical protein